MSKHLSQDDIIDLLRVRLKEVTEERNALRAILHHTRRRVAWSLADHFELRFLKERMQSIEREAAEFVKLLTTKARVR